MLISLLVLLLFSNAITIRRDKSILFSRIVISSLILTTLLAYNNIYMKALQAGLSIYGGLLNITTFSQSFNVFIILMTAIILTLNAFYPRKIYVVKLSNIYSLLLNKMYYNKNTINNKNGEQFRVIEYSLIIVFILCGAIFLIGSADLISLFLAIELQSYGLYILSTLYRDSESSTSSGLTYFLLGGLSSCFILLGSALLYINSGTTNLDNVYIITNISQIENLPIMLMYQPYYFNTALIIMFIGFLFKVSAAPFHFWSPDVYDGIPTIVTTYVAIVAKISIFAFFLEIVHYIDYDFSSFNWKNIFILSSLLSLIVGSVLGLTQFRIKRLFAYSTISHVGFILLALSINSTESIQSYIFYILQYSISNLNAFVILITIGFSLYLYVYNDNKSPLHGRLANDNYSPVQFINEIKGYFYINPYLAVSLAITLFSFVGIPPIIGFFAKQMILSAAIDSGYIFMALVAILTSVIGAGYYLNLIKQIFFYKNDYVNNPKLENTNIKVHTNNNNLETIIIKPHNIIINSSLSTSISILTLLLLLFIYIPEEWFSIVSMLTIILFKA
uniref:NADH-ubiquinone oxidoreductase chain 2 n=2 Tax=Pseudocercospora fijiensis TaxID=1873960 RepID=A0A516EZQ0_9PEZI|nr:NADH dehydrogenase subunit 2 [Pseudocercospora fijiensis]QDO71977.1 NADH dehydrogenase subunit 2 [Pseudocercospora fijiensis]